MKKSMLIISTLLILCFVSFGQIIPKITEPHTRFNPWLDACVYFFIDGHCYVDTDYCSMTYGRNLFIFLEKDKECMYDLEEYRVYIQEKEEPAEIQEKEEVQDFIFMINETDKISIFPVGFDPDEDELDYIFSEPLDENGEWQTDYGDAGEHMATVSVSDGRISATKEIIIIVGKKEEDPVIEDFRPFDRDITVEENSEVIFSVDVEDRNNDEIIYTWRLDGERISDQSSFRFIPGYDMSGGHDIEAEITDGQARLNKSWHIRIKNVNRIPEMQEIDDMTVEETEEVAITPVATDPDGDEIIFTISEPVGDDGIWRTTYDDSGIYEVEIVASDGEDSATQTVMITVENVNRAPVIRDIKKQKFN